MASGRAAWTARPSGPVRLRDESDAHPGTAVALGPEDASADDVAEAVRALSLLVADGGAVAAGAGVDLGAGFRSARLDGARGDQRDAALAALRAVGPGGAHRLGERAGFLVALFGPAVTRRVGAAAGRAAQDGRWAALHLASAASDVLGPEQLEQVLALEAPEDVDLTPGGPPSVLAQYFRQVFDQVPGPRRLALVLDLWARVLEHRAGLARRERRLATQSRRDRVADLRKRRLHDEDERILWRLRRDLAPEEPSLADAARWIPDDAYWRERLDRAFQDALAVTALLRAAVAVSDHGLEDGLKRAIPVLTAAQAQVPTWQATRTARRVPGLTGLPVRPGTYVRDLVRKMASDRPRDAKFAGYVRPRLACARDFALVVIDDIGRVVREALVDNTDLVRGWAASGLAGWREGAGYGRPPAEWAGIPPWTGPMLGDTEPLRVRLPPSQDPASVETAGDLLWYADLIDALARLYGHERAQPTPGTGDPWFDHDPPPAAEPLAPRLDSIMVAVSGAAQLAALGGVPPRAPRGWTALTGGLMSGAAITEALTGDFAVPAPLAALDGAAVPGAAVRFQVAHSARDVAGWADYMGNCIAGPAYVEDARKGRSALAGLYDKHGVLVVNAELLPLRPASRGWRVSEIAARFNDTPDERLEQRFRDWVATISPAVKEEAAPVPDELPPVRAARRRPAPRLVEDVGPALGALVRRDADPAVLGAFAAVATTAPDAALARLRRLGGAQLAGAVRRALDDGAIDLVRLWTATAHRPLAAALDALDPGLRDRFDRLPLLLGEPPLPKTLRRLVKPPAIADAYSVDLIARRLRRAIGRLTVQDDPAIAAALAKPTTEPLLCALAVTAACGASETGLAAVTRPRSTTVPGYPVTTLEDEEGPWQRALPVARELGADTARFWDEIAEHGLRVPASWLAHGGWAALWSRAHTHRR
ncbi:hypothetical protein E1293_09915 [Actinomadura darangshiensis]|uniref:Uncharacterized protein n=1 Tax=Actinomadura darangshiensis TaxID=705336 RepID=A0A4R5BQ62_9ACTN|nr:hypothetical protein [Actinomadura darangshiensis]TDD86192.1 hypothetical protein E1293_09915 [Actinomadura darangshiensis]